MATGGSFKLGIAVASLVRLILAAFVLAVPTVLMGGTLPAAARAVETDEDLGRQTLALLYGANTLGAVTGAVLCNFFMLERFGTRATVWAAALANAAVALTALRLAAEKSEKEAPQPKSKKRGRERAEIAPAARAAEEDLEALPPLPFVLAAAAVVGFVSCSWSSSGTGCWRRCWAARRTRTA